MKRNLLIIAAALALFSCGKKAATAENATADNPAGTEQDAQVYTNDKYGFTVSLPADLKLNENSLMGDDGAIYCTPDTKEGGMVLNRVDITGSRHIFDEPYTQEKIKEEFEEYTSGKDGLVKKECKDFEYSYTITGDYVTEMHRCVFSGANKADVVVCFEPDHEAQLGGEVAEKILASLKFK